MSETWPGVEMPDGDVATGLLLQMAHRAAHERLAAALRPLDMDVRHFGILQFLARGGLTQRRLIDLVGVDKSTLVRIIDQLEEQRLARRTRDPRDRRAFQVTITEPGRERLAAANAAAAEVGESLFGWLGPDQRHQLHESLQRIIHQARNHITHQAETRITHQAGTPSTHQAETPSTQGAGTPSTQGAGKRIADEAGNPGTHEAGR